MATIINFSEYQAVPPKPKSVGEDYRGQRYTLEFNPSAVSYERWTYRVKYTRTYEFTGFAESIDQARSSAKRKIAELVGREKRSV